MKADLAAVYLFESSTSQGKSYQTLLYVDGTTSCDCPGWRFKRAAVRTCKHVRLVEMGQADKHAKECKVYKPLAAQPARVVATRTLEPVRGNGRKFNFD